MTTTRVALVTGAGSGMGRSTAEVFLDHGWTVLAVDLTPVEIDSADGRLVPIAIDVRDRARSSPRWPRTCRMPADRSTRWPTLPASTRRRRWRR